MFLAIHPFKDGNGRLSRVLTTLLLLRAGYGYVPYSSMEGVIEQNKDSYYLALRRAQQTIRKEEQNWEAWLVFFRKTMAKQKDNLAAKIKEEQALRLSLPALSRQILELAKTRGEITIKEIEDMTSANRNTIWRNRTTLCRREGTWRALHHQIAVRWALLAISLDEFNTKVPANDMCGPSKCLERHRGVARHEKLSAPGTSLKGAAISLAWRR